jgi:hypothetical protein
MFQKCRQRSVTRYIICGPSYAQFYHSDPRIFYILLITSHVLTPLWDILVPYGPLHYTQNRRLADRRRKLLPDVHWYVVETVRDSLGPPSRVACSLPLYISIFLTIFILLLPVLFRIHSLFIEWHEQAFRAVSWLPWSSAFPTPRGNTDPRYSPVPCCYIALPCVRSSNSVKYVPVEGI